MYLSAVPKFQEQTLNLNFWTRGPLRKMEILLFLQRETEWA